MNFIKRGVQLSVGIAVTLFFLYWGFRNVDTSALLQSVARIEAKTIVPFIALFVVLFLLRTERWVVQVQGTIGRRPPFFKSLTINAIAFASVFFFPFRLGEFVRPYLCEREKLMSAATALSNSVLERVADGLMTCAVFGIVILMVPQGKLPDSTAIGGLVAISIFGGASIVLAIAYFFRDASVRFWTRLLTPLSIGAFDSLPEVLVSTGTHRGTQLIVHAKELRAHAMGLCAAQKQGGVNAHTFEVSGDESCKTFEQAERLLNVCAEKGLDRSSVIIAIGGGATTDLAGFVAATYMRGIDLVMVPTTLLAMCDASVGGKCAINLASGKNLVGAFHFAKAVIVDSMFLDTLPMHEIKAGLAEIVKHALLGDRDLYERLLESGFSASAQNLSDAVAVKRRIVERDPYEQNERMLLNLGHTFAHAFEKLSNYGLSHGHCVAVGLSAAAKLSAECGFLPSKRVDEIDTLLRKLRLPNRVKGASIAQIIEAMRNDKKHRGQTQRFIGLRDIAQACIIEDPSAASLENALAHVLLSENDDIVLDCAKSAKG